MSRKIVTMRAQLESQMRELETIRNRLNQLLGCGNGCLVTDLKSQLQDNDFIQAVSRYEWDGLPSYLPGQVIESLLYYNGSCSLFFKYGNLYCLPYANSGDIGTYGIPDAIEPIGYNGKSFGCEKLSPYASGKPNKNATAVIMYDRTLLPGTEHVVGRRVLQDGVIDVMNDVLKKAQINLINSTKKGVIGAESEPQAETLRNEIKAVLASDEPYAVVSKGLGDMNVFNDRVPVNLEDYIQFLSSLNNLRCSFLGIKNQGLYEKSERMITGELSGTNYQTNLILENGLKMRKLALNQLKEIYPQYKDVLNKISVKIAVDPYIDLAQKVNGTNKEETNNDKVKDVKEAKHE